MEIWTGQAAGLFTEEEDRKEGLLLMQDLIWMLDKHYGVITRYSVFPFNH